MRCWISLLLLLSIASVGFADIVQYVDSAGKVHYVSDPSKVPEEYRSQLENNPALPPITRYDHRESKGLPHSPRAASRDSAKRVEIFVTSWCGVCKGLEQYLSRQNIRFMRYDIEKNSAAHKTFQQLGGRGVPLVKIGSSVIRGFDASAIEAALHR